MANGYVPPRAPPARPPQIPMMHPLAARWYAGQQQQQQQDALAQAEARAQSSTGSSPFFKPDPAGSLFGVSQSQQQAQAGGQAQCMFPNAFPARGPNIIQRFFIRLFGPLVTAIIALVRMVSRLVSVVVQSARRTYDEIVGLLALASQHPGRGDGNGDGNGIGADGHTHTHTLRELTLTLTMFLAENRWSILVGLVVVVILCGVAWVFSPRGENQTYVTHFPVSLRDPHPSLLPSPLLSTPLHSLLPSPLLTTLSPSGNDAYCGFGPLIQSHDDLGNTCRLSGPETGVGVVFPNWRHTNPFPILFSYFFFKKERSFHRIRKQKIRHKQ